MPMRESEASTPYRTLTTLEGPRVKIGLCFYGFCNGATKNKQ